MARMKKSVEIDEYIAQFPAEVQRKLKQVRQAIRRAAPEAEEVISYRMPAFRQQGIVVYFAGWKEHVGLYPPVQGDAELEAAVAEYAGPKGNLQFPLAAPMPLDLIERIVRHRVQQNLDRAQSKKKPRRSGATPRQAPDDPSAGGRQAPVSSRSRGT